MSAPLKAEEMGQERLQGDVDADVMLSGKPLTCVLTSAAARVWGLWLITDEIPRVLFIINLFYN